MANQIGQALVGPPAPQQFVGPPAPVSPLGAAVLSPPAPVRQPGQGVTPPANLNVLQKLLYALQNDPNFRKAVAVGGMALGRTDKRDSGLTNLATGVQTGMGVLEQARDKEKAEADKIAKEKAQTDKDERQTKAAEMRLKVEQEAARRAFILDEARFKMQGADSKEASLDREHARSVRDKQLAIQAAQAAKANNAAGRATAEDKQYLIAYNYLKEKYGKEGVQVSEAELALDAMTLVTKSKEKPGSSLNMGPLVGSAISGIMSADTEDRTPGDVANEAVEVAKAVQTGLTPPPVNAAQSVADMRMREKRDAQKYSEQPSGSVQAIKLPPTAEGQNFVRQKSGEFYLVETIPANQLAPPIQRWVPAAMLERLAKGEGAK